MLDQVYDPRVQKVIKAEPGLWMGKNIHPYNLASLPGGTFAPANINTREFSLWRYGDVLPFVQTSDAWRQVTLGEGCTPLVALPLPGLSVKVEYASATSSFKDRGAAVMLAKAREWGVTRVAADSSGNAGTALAAYAAKLRMDCDVFVPASTSPGKLKQMQAHGANVHLVDGPREAAGYAALEFVANNPVLYASHIMNPYFLEGTKTYAYEIWEQLGFSVPEQVILPVGHGTLVLGAYRGFLELKNFGLIDAIPKFILVQSTLCCPIARAFVAGESQVASVASATTLAEGIAIAAPPRGAQILEVVHATRGTVLTVTDAEVEQAQARLASLGFFVEATAAASFAGWLQYCGEQAETAPSTVLPLCGSGLKKA